jgi:hypothetical protein
MPYQKHPRKVTEEQFATDTTVDGSRIDSALHDIVEHHNNLPSSDISTRYMPVTYFAGWIPTPTLAGPPAQAGHKFPWQEALNAGQTVSASPPPNTNPQRVKGYQIPGVQTIEEDTALGPSQGVWTTCFPFSKPAILKRLFVHLGRDNAADPGVTAEFNLNPVYGAVPPRAQDGRGATYAPGSTIAIAAGDPTLDFVVVADVSSPFSPEDRSRTDVEVTRNQFVFSRDLFRAVPWPNIGAFNDMAPVNWPGGGPFGWMIPLEVDVPLHQECRLRVHLVIPPGFIAPPAPYNSPWFAQPHTMCHWGLTMVVLEEITA